MHYLDTIPILAKVAIASFLAVGAVIADAVAELQGWEDISLKVALMAALIFVVRLLLRQQTDHKTECKDIIAQHKSEYIARDAAMQVTLKENTEAVNKVARLTEEQTQYFRTVTRSIVDEKLKKGKHEDTKGN